MTQLCTSLSWRDIYFLLCVSRLNNDTLVVKWLEEVCLVRLSKAFSEHVKQSSSFKSFYHDRMGHGCVNEISGCGKERMPGHGEIIDITAFQVTENAIHT